MVQAVSVGSVRQAVLVASPAVRVVQVVLLQLSDTRPGRVVLALHSIVFIIENQVKLPND